MRRFWNHLFFGGCAFLGGVVGTSLLQQMGSVNAESARPAPPPALAAASDPSRNFSDRFESVIKQLGPSVVAIEASKPPAPNKEGTVKTKGTEESGSGVLVKWEGVRGTVILSAGAPVTTWLFVITTVAGTAKRVDGDCIVR